MSFDRNHYLEWYIPRVMGESAAIDLSASGVQSLAPDEVAVAAGDPWTAPHDFEARLAAWLDIPADELLFTPGATGATLLTLLTLTGAGEEVLAELPIYEPMLRQAERLTHVKRFRRAPEPGWRVSVDDIDAATSSRTALVMLTEPCNPSGTSLPREDVLAIAENARRRGAYLLINEVYRGFTSAPSFHGAADNIVVVSSLSKLLGSYWARLGWISASAKLIARLRMAHLNASMATSPAAAHGIGLMSRADELRASAIEQAKAGIDIVDHWVAATPGVAWVKPELGFGCIELPATVDDDIAFAETLHERHGVLTVPGSYFELPGHLRLSWLQAGDQLERGLELISELLQSV